jgi:hypothetical protein
VPVQVLWDLKKPGRCKEVCASLVIVELSMRSTFVEIVPACVLSGGGGLVHPEPHEAGAEAVGKQARWPLQGEAQKYLCLELSLVLLSGLVLWE